MPTPPLKTFCFCVVDHGATNVLATFCDFPSGVNIPTNETSKAGRIPAKSWRKNTHETSKVANSEKPVTHVICVARDIVVTRDISTFNDLSTSVFCIAV